MSLQTLQRGFHGFWRNSDEQAAGGLRVIEKSPMFFLDSGGEAHAISEELSIILQPTSDHPFTRGIERSRQQWHGLMVDFQRDRECSRRGIPQGHFVRVAQQSEAGDVCNRVHRAHTRLGFDFVQRFGCRAI